MICPRTVTRRSRHARIYRHLWRRVIRAPLHARRRSVGLIANENGNASDSPGILIGILESQFAGAVLFVWCKGEGVRREGGGVGRGYIVGVR